MVKPIFLHYDRATLDREYDNRAKVAAFPRYLERWNARSREVRERLAGHHDLIYDAAPGARLDL
ncbi:MAG: hypothetical protein R3202_08725 [Candidatus Competibacterales bacterium]|nr:hypothetical protein [Candidatus Competibacterales bacterium]